MTEQVDVGNLPDRPPTEVLPVGDYRAMIIESDVKPTSSGNGGERISLTWEIIEGDYAGRKVFHGINFKNPNQKAEQIGRAELKQVCQAVGKLTFADTEELHGIQAIITLKIKPGDAQYEARNEIRAVRHVDAPAPARGPVRPATPAPAPAGDPSQAPAPAAAATRPAAHVAPPAPTGGRPAAQPWKR
jgi:hypothetical protein